MKETLSKIQAAIKDPALLSAMDDQDRKMLMDWLKHAKYNWQLQARKEQLPPPGQWTTWLISAGRGWGKDLHHATPILTKNRGWITIGDISIGDEVFAWDGTPTRVSHVYRPEPRQLVKFTFSDGSSLVSSVEHEWLTWVHRDRKQFNRKNKDVALPEDWVNWRQPESNRWGPTGGLTDIGPSVKTTAQIIETFTYSKRGDLNHSIPIAKPLVYDDSPTISDPYYLGYWLGDGFSANSGALAVGTEDEDWVVSRWPGGVVKRDYNTYVLPKDAEQRKLILSLGIFKNKMVPELVFSLGYEQRLSVLRGMLDSDGYVERSKVEFSSTNKNLAEGVVRLARTLGQKPVLSEGRAKLYGKDCGPKYRVTWRPAYGVNPFLLPRKANKVTFGGGQESRNHHRMITSWEFVDYEPTVCISVEHEDSLFLAGKALIPTHNTRVGAETVRHYVNTGKYKAIGLIAPTASDARDTMIDGKGGSSLLEITPDTEKLEYFPTKRRLSWGNGAKGSAFSAEEPERLRGPQADLLWMDEIVAWFHLQETWDMAMFGLRLGQNPKNIITTTPKPLALIRELVSRAVPYHEMEPDTVADVVLTRGATMDNRDNLAPQFLEVLMKKYEGTRLGRQELYAEILDDNPNALFSQQRIDANRVGLESAVSLRRGSKPTFTYVLSRGNERANTITTEIKEVVIAVDPSMSADTTSDETGIIIAASDKNEHMFVIEDLSGIMSPRQWGEMVVRAYFNYGADCVVAEVNQGGDLVENVIRQAEKELGMGRVNYKKVRASKGKVSRAEPVGQLEEQGRIHHVGDFPKLEEQLTSFNPGYQKSPDRLDAYVWAAHHLITQNEQKGFFIF